MKPILLLDVDGVLNPLDAEDLSLFDPLEDVVGAWATQAEVYHSKHNHVRLEVLQLRFDLVWCTGWEDRANDVVGPVHGLPKLDVVRFDSMTLGGVHLPPTFSGQEWLESTSCWKLPWVASWLERHDNPPVAWVDDQIEQGDLEWANRRNVAGQPTFLVRPDPTKGLTDEHVRHLMQWALGLDLDADLD